MPLLTEPIAADVRQDLSKLFPPPTVRCQAYVVRMLAYCLLTLCWGALALRTDRAYAGALHLSRLPPPIWQPQELQWFEMPGRADDRWLLRMTLAAGGCDAQAARQYEMQLANWAERVRQESSDEPWRKAKGALELLHRQVLRQYESDADRLHETFEYGKYNCVTAAVLYVCLCARLGVEAAAWQAPEHVSCVVYVGSEAIGVEPTSPRWPAPELVSPSSLSLVCSNFALHRTRATTGHSRQLSLRALAAAVYYNIGSRALLDGRYSLALHSNHKALLLDPQNEPAARNLLAAINNWAVSEAQAGDSQAAVRLLRLGLEVAPGHAAFKQNLEVLQPPQSQRATAIWPPRDVPAGGLHSATAPGS